MTPNEVKDRQERLCSFLDDYHPPPIQSTLFRKVDLWVGSNSLSLSDEIVRFSFIPLFC
jgi:hypothetical protein